MLMGCAIGQFCMSVNSTCLYVYIPYYMQQEMGTTATQAGAATSIISFMTTVFGAILLVAMVKAQRHSVFGLKMCIRDSHYDLENASLSLDQFVAAVMDKSRNPLGCIIMNQGWYGLNVGFVKRFPSISVGDEFRALMAPVSYTHLDVYKRQTLH